MLGSAEFHLNAEMESTIAVAKSCLQIMKSCCEMGIPFHPATEMESAISVAEDCVGNARASCELARKLGKLDSYKREHNTTRIMLLLIEYGTEEGFVENVKSAISQFGSRLSDLKGYTADVERMRTRAYCPTCQGTGEIARFRVIRERGSRPHLRRQVTCCNTCVGSGRILMRKELVESVALFLDKAREVLKNMGKFHQSLNEFSVASFKRLQTKQKEVPKEGALLQQTLYAPTLKGEMKKKKGVACWHKHVDQKRVSTHASYRGMPISKRLDRKREKTISPNVPTSKTHKRERKYEKIIDYVNRRKTPFATSEVADHANCARATVNVVFSKVGKDFLVAVGKAKRSLLYEKTSRWNKDEALSRCRRIPTRTPGAQSSRLKRERYPKVNCPQCGKEIFLVFPNDPFCSSKCSREYRKKARAEDA